MFRTTVNKGFKITFPNGWTISVQFGPGNYCKRRWDMEQDPREAYCWESPDAEVAWWRGDDLPSENKLKGCLSPTEVLALMNEIAAKEPLS